MQTIFVMVKCEPGRAYEVADEAVDIERVSEVHSISGQYDLMLKCYLEAGQDIGLFVVETLQRLPGVRDTFTITAYKAFT
ncbi:MAG: Lrp/AsnC ligand binding domain-containing protein [Pseudomonadota bacterium]